MASDYEKLMAEFGYNANPMDSLNQLLTGLRQMNQYQTNKATAKTENFVNVIKATNTVEGLENLTVAIDNWDKTTDNKSYSDVGDLPKLLHGQKLETLQLAQRGYDDLIGLVDKYPMQEETDYKITEDALMKDNLFENKKLLTQIAIAKNRLLSASKLGFRPKGDLDVEALSVHAELLDEMIGKKVNLLVSSGNFDIPDEDIQLFKDNFGVQMYGLNQKEFGNYLDNYRNVLSQKYDMNERLANNYYDLMVRAGQSPSGASSTKELDTVNQQLVGGGDIIGTEAMCADRYEEYRTVATKINEQNKGLFGQYVVDNDRFKELGTVEDDINTDITSYLNSQGTEEEGVVQKELEGEEEVSAPLTVAPLKPGKSEVKEWGLPIPGAIHKPGEKIIFKSEKVSKFQDTLLKNMSDEDYRNSIIGTTAKTMTGDSVKILSIDGDVVHTDKGDFRKEQLKIDSLTKHFSPLLKKAKGQWLFYNPLKNRYEQFGSNVRKEFSYASPDENVVLFNHFRKDANIKIPKITRVNERGEKNVFYWFKGSWKGWDPKKQRMINKPSLHFTSK